MTCLVATVHVSGSQPWWGREWGPSSLPMAQKVPWPGFSVAVVLPCFQGSHGEARGDALTSSQGDGISVQQTPGPSAVRLFWAAGEGRTERECLWTEDQLT